MRTFIACKAEVYTTNAVDFHIRSKDFSFEAIFTAEFWTPFDRTIVVSIRFTQPLPVGLLVSWTCAQYFFKDGVSHLHIAANLHARGVYSLWSTLNFLNQVTSPAVSTKRVPTFHRKLSLWVEFLITDYAIASVFTWGAYINFWIIVELLLELNAEFVHKFCLIIKPLDLHLFLVPVIVAGDVYKGVVVHLKKLSNVSEPLFDSYPYLINIHDLELRLFLLLVFFFHDAIWNIIALFIIPSISPVLATALAVSPALLFLKIWTPFFYHRYLQFFS